MGYMFRGAEAFNQPLSFDTAVVTYVSAYACFESDDSNEKPDSDFLFPTLQMRSMFEGATAFNQNLCHFGDYFSQITNLADIFLNAGCTYTNDPVPYFVQVSPPVIATRPWCAVTNCPP